MFNDGRSKKVVFIAHCLLNQNSISDGTAVYPATFKEIIDYFINADIGVIQMPCPELSCLGLDRGNVSPPDWIPSCCGDSANCPILEYLPWGEL